MTKMFDHIGSPEARAFIVERLSDDALLCRSGYTMRQSTYVLPYPPAQSAYARDLVAAICAAPGLIVSQLPSLEGKRFTCYDGFEDAPAAKGGEYLKTAAVADGNLITGRGPGCAVEFALAIVRRLKGADLADGIRASMMI